MYKSTVTWIIASISFFVSMLMFACGWIFAGAIATFTTLGLALVVSGWVLWFTGLVFRLKGD